MKRYWKLAVLIPLIVVCIGIYYIWLSGGAYPQYVLKWQEGNEKEALPVLLQANYRNEPLSISSDGSLYRNEQSFREVTDAKYYMMNDDYNKLVKEHRSFMRGKRNLSSVYEDDRIIGYADINYKSDSKNGKFFNFRFAVSVYDKSRKDSSSFEVSVPRENEYYNLNMADVQMDGRNMKLITYNSKRNPNKQGSYISEVHLYTLDLDKKTVVEDQAILTGFVQDDDNPIDIRGVLEANPTKASRYAIFNITYSKKNTAKQSPETVARQEYAKDKEELVVYDIPSGRLAVIQDAAITSMLKETDDVTVRHSGNELFLTSWKDPKGPRIIRYNLADNKMMKDLTIAFKDGDKGGEEVQTASIANNRIYMLVNSMKDETSPPRVVIAELDNGTVVYQGAVATNDNRKLRNLTIFDIVGKQQEEPSRQSAWALLLPS